MGNSNEHRGDEGSFPVAASLTQPAIIVPSSYEVRWTARDPMRKDFSIGSSNFGNKDIDGTRVPLNAPYSVIRATINGIFQGGLNAAILRVSSLKL